MLRRKANEIHFTCEVLKDRSISSSYVSIFYSGCL